MEQLQKDIENLFQPKDCPKDLTKELRLRAEEELRENPDRIMDDIAALRRMIEGKVDLKILF